MASARHLLLAFAAAALGLAVARPSDVDAPLPVPPPLGTPLVQQLMWEGSGCDGQWGSISYAAVDVCQVTAGNSSGYGTVSGSITPGGSGPLEDGSWFLMNEWSGWDASQPDDACSGQPPTSINYTIGQCSMLGPVVKTLYSVVTMASPAVPSIYVMTFNASGGGGSDACAGPLLMTVALYPTGVCVPNPSATSNRVDIVSDSIGSLTTWGTSDCSGPGIAMELNNGNCGMWQGAPTMVTWATQTHEQTELAKRTST